MTWERGGITKLSIRFLRAILTAFNIREERGMSLSLSHPDEILLARANKILEVISQLETAIDEVTTGGVRSYKVDTGQTIMEVTRHSLTSVSDLIESLTARYEAIYSRLYGGGSVVVGPSF